MKEKWNRDLPVRIDELTWKTTFNICFNTSTLHENVLIWFKMKILHRILGVKKHLWKL